MVGLLLWLGCYCYGWVVAMVGLLLLVSTYILAK